MQQNVSDCEFKTGGCDDPRCKRGFCLLEQEERAAVAAQATAQRERVAKRAEEIAIRHLKAKGNDNPSVSDIQRVATRETIVAMAAQQLADEDALPLP